jgi:hypothetical protein
MENEDQDKLEDLKPEGLENNDELASTAEPTAEVYTQQIGQIKPRKHLSTKMKILITVFAVVLVSAGAFALTGKKDKTIADTDSNVTVEKVTTFGATIALAEGIVEYSEDGENWKTANGDESLAQSDYIRTGEESRAIVLFDDGSVARLDNSTEIWLTSLEKTGQEITLVSGQVYTRIVESDELPFSVITVNERFESLGTAYKTATNGEVDTLEVYQSNVKVGSQDTTVTEGNKYDTDTKEIGEIDLSKLAEDEFAQWNKQKDSEEDKFKDKLGVLKDEVEKPVAAPESTQIKSGITLSATEQADGVKLSWVLNGVNSAQGFKVVRSATDNTPTFGENDAQYVGDPSASSKVWYSDKGGTYFYRVCIYLDGSCTNYSNTVQAKSPEIKKEPVISGGINLSINDNTISWSLNGGNAPHGFKVLLKTSSSPTYPDDSIQYTGAQTTKLPEKTPGTYYVKVCKYTNGTQTSGCVDYSNEVSYVITE